MRLKIHDLGPAPFVDERSREFDQPSWRGQLFVRPNPDAAPLAAAKVLTNMHQAKDICAGRPTLHEVRVRRIGSG
jgi:hypothetical protein